MYDLGVGGGEEEAFWCGNVTRQMRCRVRPCGVRTHPPTVVRPQSGEAAAMMQTFDPSSVIVATSSLPTLPRSVESTFLYTRVSSLPPTWRRVSPSAPSKAATAAYRRADGGVVFGFFIRTIDIPQRVVPWTAQPAQAARAANRGQGKPNARVHSCGTCASAWARAEGCGVGGAAPGARARIWSQCAEPTSGAMPRDSVEHAATATSASRMLVCPGHAAEPASSPDQLKAWARRAPPWPHAHARTRTHPHPHTHCCELGSASPGLRTTSQRPRCCAKDQDRQDRLKRDWGTRLTVSKKMVDALPPLANSSAESAAPVRSSAIINLETAHTFKAARARR